MREADLIFLLQNSMSKIVVDIQTDISHCFISFGGGRTRHHVGPAYHVLYKVGNLRN